MSAPEPEFLDDKILSAHESGDLVALAELYALASEQKHKCGDTEAAGFLLTQAYVYALDCDHPSATDLRNKLIAEGREQEE